jgi:hypothetical protein
MQQHIYLCDLAKIYENHSQFRKIRLLYSAIYDDKLHFSHLISLTLSDPPEIWSRCSRLTRAYWIYSEFLTLLSKATVKHEIEDNPDSNGRTSWLLRQGGNVYCIGCPVCRRVWRGKFACLRPDTYLRRMDKRKIMHCPMARYPINDGALHHTSDDSWGSKVRNLWI